ncbi:major facilitator superfamily domain-containing protein [Xylaria cf. heliscus]|nr:major facilitator superfamily domain-containing protein [Xylaria cf. heliscus]
MGGYFSTLKAGARRVADEIEYDPQNPDAAIQSVIDRPGLDGFQWRVWWVTASGFFTTSYSIFAVNVISPALEYVYPEKDCPPNWPGNSLIINLTTLTGTIFGALVFGFLADRYGRKTVYGLELAIVVAATIGMTTASTGVGSMKVYGWIGFWRALLGIGLGAEYPLSSIIAAEWSSTRSRGRMMAAVFLMQSVGQLAAYGFGLAVLVGMSKNSGLSPDETNREIAVPKIDAIWRIIIGVGAIPALISLVLRRTIPETPYYLVETGRVADAITAAGQVYAPEITLQPTAHEELSPFQTPSNSPAEKSTVSKGGWCKSAVGYIREVKDHLSQKSRWRALLGVMLTWWLLDLAYYGLGFDNPKTISAIWSSTPTSASSMTTSTTQCGTDVTQQNGMIYRTLQENIVHNIITISTGALPGSIIILCAIDYVPRVTWMMWTFVALAALFAVNGGTFFIAFQTDKHALTIVLYVLAEILFNLGANTITFILPAELFTTKYRGTFYGLAAASGKLGAITILLIINFGVYRGNPFLTSSHELAGTLLGFAPAMLLGAFIAWVWIPEVQFPRGHRIAITRDENTSDDGLDHDLLQISFRENLKLPNRPLAHIAQDPQGGQILGVRRNLRRLIHRNKGRREATETASILESGANRISRQVGSSASHYVTHTRPFNGQPGKLGSGEAGERESGGMRMNLPDENSSVDRRTLTDTVGPQRIIGRGSV